MIVSRGVQFSQALNDQGTGGKNIGGLGNPRSPTILQLRPTKHSFSRLFVQICFPDELWKKALHSAEKLTLVFHTDTFPP